MLRFIGYAVVVIAVLFLGLAMLGSMRSPGPPDLRLAVRHADGALFILNLETSPAIDCLVEINDRFTIKHKIIAAGQAEASWPLSSFADSSGERFSILTHKPLNVFVSCEGPEPRHAAFKFK